MKKDILNAKDFELSYIRKMGNPKTKKTENELIILLPVGCYWAKNYSGCSYCGYQALVDELSEKYSYNLLEIVKTEYKKNSKNVTRVSFFVGGSFFEIKPNIQNEIISYITSQKEVNEIYIESRPELITTNNIIRLKNIVKDKKLTVAIGLETHDEKIRNDVHTKGITNQSFEAAMEILKRNHIDSLIYIFVKPPIKNYTDEDAYLEALESIEYAIKNGGTSIELESGYIVENSKMHDLYQQGFYVPLKLWTINKLLVEATNKYQDIPIRLAYFTDTPEPIDGPKGCEECDYILRESFQKYREVMDITLLPKTFSCQCTVV